MRIIKPMVIVEDDIDGVHFAKKIEYFTRKCYKSEAKTTADSYDAFVRKIFRTMKHEGIIEHRSFSATFVTDRGVSHEGVRHRMASYLQESTRYVDYSNRGCTFIQPPWVYPGHQDWKDFVSACEGQEIQYNNWRQRGWAAQQARFFLPNGIKTEYAASKNLGSWYNFLCKRTPSQAHPQMRQLAIPLLRHLHEKIPVIFDGIIIPSFEYEEAKLIVNPYYDPVEYEVVEG